MEMVKGRRRLLARFALLLGVSAVLVFAVYYAWTAYSESAENERRALAEARTLSAQMDASWDYIDSIQNRINYTKGYFDFKGVYCSVAGKSIARRFSEQTDYSIRYVRENPRSGTDVPDPFERKALETFASGRTEYYAMTEYEGQPAFRYVSVLKAETGCLSCHGEPAGQKDVTGFCMEGMALGDVAGAVSIVLPMGSIEAESNADLASTVVFFCALMAVVTLVLAWGIRRWVADPIVNENDRLRREAESQSNFLTIVTHELKTPLAAIIALTELSKRQARSDKLNAEETLADIELNSQVLLGQINNLLDAAKLDEGSLGLACEDVDVYDVIGLVRRVAEPLASRAEVRFEVEPSSVVPVVVADREMLRRVMTNLVGNALRYTPPGGTVALTVGYADGVLSVAVRDTGDGIAEDQMESIFERFSTTPGSQDSGVGGTGLGLSIVKAYADMAGGSVSVESAKGQGSLFTVSIPAERACLGGEGE